MAHVCLELGFRTRSSEVGVHRIEHCWRGQIRWGEWGSLPKVTQLISQESKLPSFGALCDSPSYDAPGSGPCGLDHTSPMPGLCLLTSPSQSPPAGVKNDPALTSGRPHPG